MYRRFSYLYNNADSGEDSEEETGTETEETGTDTIEYTEQLQTIIDNQEEIIEQNNLIYQSMMNILFAIVFFFVFKFIFKQIFGIFHDA